MTDISHETAAALGFPKPHYTLIERERRWLCRNVPLSRVVRTEAITDLYVTGARLRLREARPTDGGEPMLRLSRKGDVDIHTRLITSIYLSEAEFAVLAASLKGLRITKLRHRLQATAGAAMCVDVFQGALKGLILAEAEFDSAEALSSFCAPDFAVREVTNDPRFTGAWLASNGVPKDLSDNGLDVRHPS